MAKRDVVEVTDEERARVETLGKQGKVVARKVRRAQLLVLAADGYPDTEMAAARHGGVSPVERSRKRFVEGGVEGALTERPRPGGRPKLRGKDEAVLIATACSAPPRGRQRWTVQLLADRVVEGGLVDTSADETIRRTLKKTTPRRGYSNTGVCRRSVPNWSGAGKTCGISMPNPMTGACRSGVSMRGPSNWWGNGVSLRLGSPVSPSGMLITSTATAPVTCSCALSPGTVDDRWR
jgi:hypothetical protein